MNKFIAILFVLFFSLNLFAQTDYTDRIHFRWNNITSEWDTYQKKSIVKESESITKWQTFSWDFERWVMYAELTEQILEDENASEYSSLTKDQSTGILFESFRYRYDFNDMGLVLKRTSESRAGPEAEWYDPFIFTYTYDDNGCLLIAERGSYNNFYTCDELGRQQSDTAYFRRDGIWKRSALRSYHYSPNMKENNIYTWDDTGEIWKPHSREVIVTDHRGFEFLDFDILGGNSSESRLIHQLSEDELEWTAQYQVKWSPLEEWSDYATIKSAYDLDGRLLYWETVAGLNVENIAILRQEERFTYDENGYKVRSVHARSSTPIHVSRDFTLTRSFVNDCLGRPKELVRRLVKFNESDTFERFLYNYEKEAVCDLVEKDDWAIYPNPSSGIINISSPLINSGQSIVRVFDAIGRLIKEQDFCCNNPTLNMNLEDLSNGIYFVQVQNEDFEATKKIAIFK